MVDSHGQSFLTFFSCKSMVLMDLNMTIIVNILPQKCAVNYYTILCIN